MFLRRNPIKFICYCILLAGCNTQPNEVEFPLDETEYKKPRTVKATPRINQIPKNLPSAKYTTEKGMLVVRDQSAPIKIAKKQKLGQPGITVSGLKRSKIPTNPKVQSARAPQIVEAKGKSVPARGKVVMAGKPMAKPYLQPIIRALDNYGLHNISQDQNLPGAIGYALLEDSQGRIWIGTDNGLAILEGGEMKIYTPQEGLSSNRIWSLLESSTGAIWIGSEGGLDVFESGSFTHYGTEEGLSDKHIYSLLEAADGAIWIGTYGGGVNVFKSGSFTHYGTAEGLSSNIVVSLAESISGAIWIGTYEDGLDVYESGSFTHYGMKEGLSDNRVKSLMASSSGAIWIGTYGGGVDVFESGIFTNYSTEQGMSNNQVYSLLESSAGAIWIGTYGGGLDVLESGFFTHFGNEEGLSSDRIKSLLETSSGAIWIGTLGEGVDVFESGNFTHYGIEEGLGNISISSLIETSTGSLWIGTDGGLDVFEDDKFLHYGTEQGLSSDIVVSLMESSTGTIWIGHYEGGVDVYESGLLTHYGTPEGLSTNRIRCLLETSSGAIWIGTYSGGVNVFESGNFTHFGTEEGLSSSNVLSLLESSTGAIWVGTYGGGLNVFESGSFTHYGIEEGLSNKDVTSLLESNTGAIWVGTRGGGIDVFESGSFTNYGTSEGLADNTVTQLAKDSLGNIWAGTGKGMTRFVAKEKGYELTSWNKTQGLKYMDFNGPGSPMIFTKTNEVSKKGTMWSSVGSVLTAFEPPVVDTRKPGLFLTGVDIGQKPIDWGSISDLKDKMETMRGIESDTIFFSDPDSVLLLSNYSRHTRQLRESGIRWDGIEDSTPYHLPVNLELAHNQNHLTFHYSGMKFSEQFDIVYRYVLEGFDKSWSPFTREGKADYRNIPHGTYTFRVRARGRNFLWSDEASIDFVIHPPWWQTNWAKTLWAFLIVGGLYMIYFIRIRILINQKRELEQTVGERTAEIAIQADELQGKTEALQELNATKDKFFSIISHDLKGPLTSLSFFVFLLKSRLDSMTKEEIRGLISDLDESQQNVDALLDNLLSWSLSQTGQIQFIPEEFDLTALLEENRQLFKSQSAYKDLTISFGVTEKLIIKAHKDSLATVIRNLISNAIKFTPEKGKITLTLEQQDNEVVVSVSDTGVGMSRDMIEKVFSLETKHLNIGTAGEKGNGLGLILCKEFVEKNGGKIWITSEVNVGSSFMFSIPMS